jgi:hypothetical protein
MSAKTPGNWPGFLIRPKGRVILLCCSPLAVALILLGHGLGLVRLAASLVPYRD